MDVAKNSSRLAIAAVLSSPTQNSELDSELPLLLHPENSIISSGESATDSDSGHYWDPENPENQMGLYENGGVWGPGWKDRFYTGQKVCWETSYFIKHVVRDV
jgi:hypothetical protein